MLGFVFSAAIVLAPQVASAQLQVSPHAFRQAFGSPWTHLDRHVFFVCEEVVVEIKLLPALAKDPTVVVDDLVQSLEDVGTKQPVSLLTRQGAHAMEFALLTQSGRPLPIGTYRLTVRGTLRRTGSPAARVVAGTEFDVLPVLTPTDEMNRDHHLAVRARWRQDFKTARTLLDKILGMSPRSAAAHAELGATYKAEGRCAEAIAEWNRAISLITSGEDADAAWRTTAGNDDVLFFLRQSISRCQ